MNKVEVTYYKCLDKLVVYHREGEEFVATAAKPTLVYEADCLTKEHISEARLKLCELFQADVQQLTKEFNEAEAMLMGLEEQVNKKSKKTYWIFRKDKIDGPIPNWAYLIDGLEAIFDRDTDIVGKVDYYNITGRLYLVTRDWCEEVTYE